jgi:hypothetical protein
MSIARRFTTSALLAATTVLGACGDDDTNDAGAGDSEVISRVTISLTPVGGGATQQADITFSTPTTPGAQNGALVLQKGVTYEGSVEFTNTFANPPVDITEEVALEADEHRIFYTVTGPAGVSIPTSSLDQDDNGAPVGLTYQVVVTADAASGAGTIRVVLSHYDDQPKGDGATPSNETDVDVTFAYTVP